MPRVIIIGGGIGGLTAAVAFRRRGWGVAVYEAASEFKPVGKGIWVPPNAMQVLARLGLADAVIHAGWPLDRIQLRTTAGAVLSIVDLDAVKAEFGHTIVSVHRAKLLELLAAGLPPDALHLGHRFNGFTEEPGRVVAHFEGGREASADLLVGADGLRSAVREQLFPGVPLRYSGQTCYRGVSMMDLPAELSHTCWEVWGGRRRFGFSAIGPRQVYWFAPVTAPAGAVEGFRAEWYAGFPEPIQAIVAASHDLDTIQTDLYDFAPIPRWHAGRVVLLGDAAHAMTPNLGQGGAQAIEDAFVLAERVGGSEPLADALAGYEAVRRPKATWVVKTAWQLGKLSHWQSAPARWLRDRALRWTPGRMSRASTRRLYRLGY